MVTKTIIAAILFLIVIGSGTILRKRGEPYATIIFTLHKLSLVGIVVLVILIYIEHFKSFQFEGLGWILFLISGLSFTVSFITGALLSFEKFSSYRLKIIHRVLSWLTIVFIPVIWLVCH